jgi:hypothetical protein
LKKIKKEKEMQPLKQLAGHPNVVELLDVLYDEPMSTGCILFKVNWL